ncbi:MAG TPA: DUF417 family protein, partial [Pyrinomonadaceae bacterium]|nr:DUF417 family protein [Pyrinomonadaceae bacterium]
TCYSFIATFTIIPFMSDGWAASAGGFPAMSEKVAFLMKDLILFAASFYLLRQDLARTLSSPDHLRDSVQTRKLPLHVKQASKLPGVM